MTSKTSHGPDMANSDPTDELTRFKNWVLDDQLPKFCGDPRRGMGTAGFKQQDWSKFSKLDMKDFLRAMDANMIKHVGGGEWCAPKSGAREHLFSSGPTKLMPRTFWLVMEPIITVAALARLHFKFGWPIKFLGMQPKGWPPRWPFDLAAYNPSDPVKERFVCEVKNSTSERVKLVTIMTQLAANNVQSEASVRPSEINAFRKLKALRDRKVPIFWALGPDGAGDVFRMVYGEDGLVTFNLASEHDLRFREAYAPAASDAARSSPPA